jgi:lipoic acid synthetase
MGKSDVSIKKPRLPDWFRVRYKENGNSAKVSELLKKHRLHTVCQSAHCPNCSVCWGQGTASFMILGEFCTRACRFCAVKTMADPPMPDADEPEHLAQAVQELGLRYVVVTSVTRDDLPDGGAGHFAECVRKIRSESPETIIELLIPDLVANPNLIKTVTDSRPDVISHNIETVERITPLVRDRRASFKQSLATLKLVSMLSDGNIIAKSGLMLGFGEREEEVHEALKALRDNGTEIVTIGQYLPPSPAHLKVAEFISPERFEAYGQMAYSLGFKYVASGPLVRSSYKAGEPFIEGALKSRSR